jgi:hypothetical protein
MDYIVAITLVISAPNEDEATEITDLMLRTRAYIKEYKITHVEIKDGKP